MTGIKRISKREKTSYRPSDLWDERDLSVFLRYCPNKRDKCYYAMAFDMSARPHEILSLRIKDIKFCHTEDNKRYVEVRIPDGKTGSRVVVLIDSIPYLKVVFGTSTLNKSGCAYFYNKKWSQIDIRRACKQVYIL